MGMMLPMVSQIDCSDLPATITIIAQLVSCTFIKTGCKLLPLSNEEGDRLLCSLGPGPSLSLSWECGDDEAPKFA